MAVQTLKEKKWALVGAFIGALLFPTLSYLLDLTAHLIRFIIGV